MLQVELPTNQIPTTTTGNNNRSSSSFLEQDIVVVVGGKEFHEHSHILRSWSQFFDNAFRNNSGKMTSRQQKLRFDIPHRKPEEWVVLMSMFSKPQITIDNYEIILSWSRELTIPSGLKACDQFISDYLERLPTFEYVQKILDLLSTSVQYDLPKSKDEGIKAVQLLLKFGNGATLTVDHFKQITSFIVKDEDCREKLWRYLRGFVPDDVFPTPGSRSHDANDVKAMYDIIESPAFPYLLYSGMKSKILEHKVASALQVANTTGNIQQVKTILSEKAVV